MQRRTLLALGLASAAVLTAAGGAAAWLQPCLEADGALAPYFAQAEQRLGITPWTMAPNENNDLLRRGASQLGIAVATISRNVRGCWNLGSCGLGCPINAKQSMLVTTIPAALALGAQLLTETRSERFELANGRVSALICHAVAPNGALAQAGRAQAAIKIIVEHYVLAGGAINSPALLDYPLTAYVMDGARRALLSMMEMQFAAGARQVLPLHEMAAPYGSWAQARQAVAALPMKPRLVKIVSAHVMGGCALAGSERLGVARPDGVHWPLGSLSIHDGSLFPTSVGANPQLSVYGVVNRLAQHLVTRLGGRSVALA